MWKEPEQGEDSVASTKQVSRLSGPEGGQGKVKAGVGGTVEAACARQRPQA